MGLKGEILPNAESSSHFYNIVQLIYFVMNEFGLIVHLAEGQRDGLKP